MNTVIDTLFLRVPALEYVSPPVCGPVAFASSTSESPIIIPPWTRPVSSAAKLLGGEAAGFYFIGVDWSIYAQGAGAGTRPVCLTFLKALDDTQPNGAYLPLAECVPPSTVMVCEPGDYEVRPVVSGVEGAATLTQNVSSTGTLPAALTIPVTAGAECYNLYLTTYGGAKELAMSCFNAPAMMVCQPGCYKVQVITDGGATDMGASSCPSAPQNRICGGSALKAGDECVCAADPGPDHDCDFTGVPAIVAGLPALGRLRIASYDTRVRPFLLWTPSKDLPGFWSISYGPCAIAEARPEDCGGGQDCIQGAPYLTGFWTKNEDRCVSWTPAWPGDSFDMVGSPADVHAAHPYDLVVTSDMVTPYPDTIGILNNSVLPEWGGDGLTYRGGTLWEVLSVGGAALTQSINKMGFFGASIQAGADSSIASSSGCGWLLQIWVSASGSGPGSADGCMWFGTKAKGTDPTGTYFWRRAPQHGSATNRSLGPKCIAIETY